MTRFVFIGLLIAGVPGCGSGDGGAARGAADSTRVDTLDVLRKLTVLDVLKSDRRFSAFTSAIDSAGVAGQFEGQGPITVFAPTNDVFAPTVSRAGGAQGLAYLRAVLLHYATGRSLTDSVLSRQDSFRVASLEGEPLLVTHDSTGTFVNGIPVHSASVTVGNGTVHVLKAALNPPENVPSPSGATARPATARRAPTPPSAQ